MSKREPIDLAALTKLTADEAAPMPEAAQRTLPKDKPGRGVKRAPEPVAIEPVKTENLEGPSFKVSSAFRVRFRQRAAVGDMKLNELLFEALDAWEEKHGLT